MTRAALALKKTEEAEKAAQWMFDMRPPTAQTYYVGALVREALSDVSGAVEFMMQGLRLVEADQRGEKAYLLVYLAELELKQNRKDFARSYATQAKILMPDYPRAIALLKKVNNN
jgi:hypothetical protein